MKTKKPSTRLIQPDGSMVGRPTSGNKSPYRTTTARFTEQTLAEAVFIARELGLNSRTSAMSFAIRQVYRKLKKAAQ